MEGYNYVDWIEAKKNLNRQATKVLHYIVDRYVRGELDNPDNALQLSSLLACICEGKVKGILDEEEMKVKWSLEPEYEKQVRELYEAFKQAAGLDDEESADNNVIQGPWKK